ncbi:MAG: undecaprenyl-phosphate glucose phosphotransferase [Magnetococcus sp. WYHC-3]
MRQGPLRQKDEAINALLRLFDLMTVVMAGVGSWVAVMKRLPNSRDLLNFGLLEFAEIGMAVLAGWYFLFSWFNLYRAWRGVSLWTEVKVIFWSVSCLVGITALVMVAVGAQDRLHRPDLHLLFWYAFTFLLMSTYRISFRFILRTLRSHGFNHKRVVIAGAGSLGQHIARQISHATWTGLEVIGFFDDRHEELKGTVLANNLPCLGTLDDVNDYVENNNIHQVWMALPLRAVTRMTELEFSMRHSTAELHMIPDIFVFKLLNYSMDEVASIPRLNLQVRPIRGASAAAKTVVDMGLALVGLLVLALPMLVIAALIKLTSPGPVIFRQQRHGFDSKPIEVWKFRTMYLHSEDSGQITQATRNDSRITPIGRVLRKLSLDELPQLINVLQGRMSLVGPRPHAVEHNDYYKQLIDRYMVRHIVKPGITGWAQVNGLRGETPTVETMRLRIECDLYYVENWSLWFDIRIIFMTIWTILKKENAY